MKDKAKVFLICPPIHMETAPLLGISILKPFLNRKGVDCEVVDLNIRFLYWLWEDGHFIEEISKEAIEFYNRLQGKNEMNPGEAPKFAGMLSSLSLMPAYLLKRYLHEEVLEGSLCEPLPGAWYGNMLGTSYMLNSLQGDYAASIPLSFKDVPNGRKRLFDSFNRFLSSAAIKPILEKISQADILGLSVSYSRTQLEYALSIAGEVRRLNPKAFIIFGGSGFSGLNDRKRKEILLNNDLIDAMGLYDGENILLQLASAVAGNKPIKEVPNLLYYDKKTEKFTQTHFQEIIHPDDLPTPEYNDTEVQLYYRASKQWVPGIRLPVFVSRGCYWGKCVFCGDPLAQQPDQPVYLQRSAEKVREDVEKLKRRYNASYFYLVSPALAPKWLENFSQEVVKKGLSVKFRGYLRIAKKSTMNRKFFLLLKDAGFDFVSCCVESTSDRVLAKLEKGSTREDVTYMIRGLSSAGIRTRVNLIYDLPFATLEDLEQDWKFVKENIAFIDDLSTFKFSVIDQTPIAKEPGKYNVEFDRNEDGSPKVINYYSVPFENPFYELEGSQKMTMRFRFLSRKLQFHRLTRDVRERVAVTGFSWERSFIMMRPFTVVGSRFSFRDNHKVKKVYFMFLDDIYNVVEIPGSFLDLIRLFQGAVREPVPYNELLGAFMRGLQGFSNDWGFPIKDTWERLLVHFVYQGFIRDIESEPCFFHINTESYPPRFNADTITDELTNTSANKNMIAGNDTFSSPDDNVKVDESLPFVFFSAPFAGVAQAKLF